MEKTEKKVIKTKKQSPLLELMNLLSDYKKDKNKHNEEKIRKFLRTTENRDGKLEAFEFVYAYVNAFLMAQAYFIIGELDELPVMNMDNNEMEVYENDR